MAPKRARRPGRPPAGVHKGERVSEYEPFTVRLPRDVKALLRATSDVTDAPMWKVVHDAIGAYVKQLSATDRKLIHGLTARRRHKTK